jgi:hypothetical protein
MARLVVHLAVMTAKQEARSQAMTNEKHNNDVGSGNVIGQT